uniref:Chlorophyll synthase n=1 Tax=Tetraselmis sp. GSL018 TaxID=582737 RepID=A0A061S1F3_9CHLO
MASVNVIGFSPSLARAAISRKGNINSDKVFSRPCRHTRVLPGVGSTNRLSDKGYSRIQAKNTTEETEDANKGIFQLLGMKGAGDTDDKLKIRIQLMKPVTWVPLIWGVLCGAAASGHFEWTPENVAKSALCMTMSGPLLTGYTQTINDYFDREIDAINEPYRPIPSGKISEAEVVTQFLLLLTGGIGVASAALDVWAGHDFPVMTLLAVFGSFISYIYSAPPLKLKQSGWAGNYALGSSYIALPWWAGQALFGTLTADVMVLTVLYSLAGLGIAIVNDFKSIEGDRALGLQSLPVAFGVEGAKWICVSTIDVTQLGVAAYLEFGRRCSSASSSRRCTSSTPTSSPTRSRTTSSTRRRRSPSSCLGC